MLLITQAISSWSEALELSIDAIAMTAQRSSVILVNKDGKPLMPAIMWPDAPTCGEHEMSVVQPLKAK